MNMSMVYDLRCRAECAVHVVIIQLTYCCMPLARTHISATQRPCSTLKRSHNFTQHYTLLHCEAIVAIIDLYGYSNQTF